MTSPVKMWTKQVSSSTPLPSTTLATGLAVTTGLDGAIYVGGFALGAFDGQANSGGYDGFLTKYNANGTKAWSKLLGTSLNEQATCLTIGLDGAIYIGGNTAGALDGETNSGNNDAFLTKYNPDGTKAWTKLLGTAGSENANSLTTGVDGAIYVGGTTSGALDGQTNSGSGDAFLTKFRDDGTKVWTKLLGTSDSESIIKLTSDLDGAIYVGGTTWGALDGETNSGSADVFLTKYNDDGTKVWTRLLGSSQYEVSGAITTGLDGAIYIGGTTMGSFDGQTNSGSGDGFLTKYNPDGTKAWTKLLGSAGGEAATSLTTGLDGAIYVGGYTTGALDGQTNSGSADGFLTKYNPDGTKVWTELLGSNWPDYTNALTTGIDGTIYAAQDRQPPNPWNIYISDVYLVKYREAEADSAAITTVIDASDSSSSYGLYKMSSGAYAVAEFGLDLDAVPESPMLMMADSKGKAWTTAATIVAINQQTNAQTNAEEIAILTVAGTGAKVTYAEEIFTINLDRTKLTSKGKPATLTVAQAIEKELSYGQDFNGDSIIGNAIKTVLDASDGSSNYGLYKMSSGAYAVAGSGLDPDAVPESPMLMMADSKGKAWTTAATTVAINQQTNAQTNAEEIAILTIAVTGGKAAYAEEIFTINLDRTKLTSKGKPAKLTVAQAIEKELSYGQDFNGDGSIGSNLSQFRLQQQMASDFAGSTDSQSSAVSLVGITQAPWFDVL